MRVEGSGDTRDGDMLGSCAYAGEYPTENSGVKFYGILKIEEQSDEL